MSRILMELSNRGREREEDLGRLSATSLREKEFYPTPKGAELVQAILTAIKRGTG